MSALGMKLRIGALVVLAAGTVGLLAAPWSTPAAVPAGREEVVFWHFWGGEDRAVVDQVVTRFNRSQDRYFVRAVSMPGNNLDLKVFLAVAGGDPPDVINQDDPIVADWARRGALIALDELATPDEVSGLDSFLVPAARRLATYDNRLYALCNGLDIRALYYDQTLLDELNLSPPQTLAELDQIARQATLRSEQGQLQRVGYLPDSRRLWAWGIVFGGKFYDPASGQVTADQPPVVAALQWMTTYRALYGADSLAAFRQGDQSLPGKTFPLLAGRYALLMDGQWRVRDIRRSQDAQRARGEPVRQYGVCPLPPPPGGRSEAGWVNGNFFVVPRNAPCPQGAWEFMKFWTGYGGHQQQAAETCVAGGWIPVSQQVAEQPVFQEYLQREPLMRTFVQLAASPNQVPTPVVPGAPLLQREINNAASQALLVSNAPPPRQLLQAATRRAQLHLDRLRTD